MTEKRLLVIDDEPAISEIVRMPAEGTAFEVRVANRPDEFARVYEDFTPTVLILDLVMPEVDDVELAH